VQQPNQNLIVLKLARQTKQHQVIKLIWIKNYICLWRHLSNTWEHNTFGTDQDTYPFFATHHDQGEAQHRLSEHDCVDYPSG